MYVTVEITVIFFYLLYQFMIPLKVTQTKFHLYKFTRILSFRFDKINGCRNYTCRMRSINNKYQEISRPIPFFSLLCCCKTPGIFLCKLQPQICWIIHKLWICDLLRLFHWNFFFSSRIIDISFLATCISLTHQINSVLNWFRLLHALVEFYANVFLLSSDNNNWFHVNFHHHDHLYHFRCGHNVSIYFCSGTVLARCERNLCILSLSDS